MICIHENGNNLIQRWMGGGMGLQWWMLSVAKVSFRSTYVKLIPVSQKLRSAPNSLLETDVKWSGYP